MPRRSYQKLHGSRGSWHDLPRLRLLTGMRSLRQWCPVSQSSSAQRWLMMAWSTRGCSVTSRRARCEISASLKERRSVQVLAVEPGYAVGGGIVGSTYVSGFLSPYRSLPLPIPLAPCRLFSPLARVAEGGGWIGPRSGRFNGRRETRKRRCGILTISTQSVRSQGSHKRHPHLY